MIPFHPFADIFPLIEGAEFEALVQGMRDHGYRNNEEIVLFEGKILDGRNRYRAAIAAGIISADSVAHVGDASWIFCEFTSEGGEGLFSEEEVATGPLAYVISKNVHRRHLDESQRAMAAARIETLKQGERKDRAAVATMPADEGDGDAAPVRPARASRDANLHVSRTEAAGLLNVSPRTVAHAAVVRDRAEPELRLAVEQGHLKVSAASKAVVMTPEQQRAIAVAAEQGKTNVVNAEIKKAARNVREAELGAKQQALTPLGSLGAKYGVILADPEWDRSVWSRETGMDRHAENQYPVSSDAEIAAREVGAIAADDCVLGIWCTEPWRGEKVARAWGFEPKSYFVWVKDVVEVALADVVGGVPPEGAPERVLVKVGPSGTGFWRRDITEILIIATRGNVPCPAPGTQGDSAWFAARPRHPEGHPEAGRIIHSAKPDCCLEWFEKHFPSLPKIELNARRARAGWARWGNEAPESGEAPRNLAAPPTPSSAGQEDVAAAKSGSDQPPPSPSPILGEGTPSVPAISEAGAKLAGVSPNAIGDALARLRGGMNVPAKGAA